MINLKSHIRTAFLYFFIAATLGVILRSFRVFEISVTYKFFVHTHSHIALLGWVYLALTTLIYMLFLQTPTKDKSYRKIFWFTQFTLVGMLLTFPFTGYALFSIIFSTLFLFASYWFYAFFLKYTPLEIKKTKSYLCVKTALLYMVVSSIGPWVLGVIMNTMGAESIWYRLAIYFYLHFQYNGWMILALVGLFFFMVERQQWLIPDSAFMFFFRAFNLGIILSFFLSTLFTNPPIVLNVLGGLGAVFQLVAFVFLVKTYQRTKTGVRALFSSFQMILLRTVVVLCGVKMLMQLLTTIPYFANLAATVLDFTIGYLHWTFLGVVTISLFLFIDYFKVLQISAKAYYLYLIGFLITECLIFYKGICAWVGTAPFKAYFEALGIGSLLIPFSLVLLFLTNSSAKKVEK